MQKEVTDEPIYDYVCKVQYSSNKYSENRIFELEYNINVGPHWTPTEEERERYQIPMFDLDTVLGNHARDILKDGVNRTICSADGVRTLIAIPASRILDVKLREVSNVKRDDGR